MSWLQEMCPMCFFFNDTATTEIYTLSLHDALPIFNQPVETVITVCGNADQACPVFPGQVNRHHWGFCDPAKAEGALEEKLAVFRRVRDEIKMVFEAYAAGRRDQAKAKRPE